ncbi:MAG: rod shape-determining protein RodA [Bacteroidales bacterium]|nr:rod shape-determining protein RodA [Bacteroidales bacterium]MBN2819245.1 rod shape-determining protein RodA [Bacteroidales bacterium]
MRRSINILTNTDWLSVFIYLVLIVFGWLNIYSVNFSETDPSFFSLENRYAMQIYFIIASVILAIIIFLIDSRFYSFIAYPLYVFSVLMLLAVMVIGKEVNGAKSWIMLGPIGIQPSEFAKLATILALARFLSGYNVKTNSPQTILKSLGIIFFAPVLIMLQPDFGSTLVYSAILIVLYREGLPGWILILLLFMAGIFLGTLMVSKFIILIILISAAAIAFFILNKNLKNFLIVVLVLTVLVLIGVVLKYFELIPKNNFLLLFGALVLSTIFYLIRAITAKIKHVFPVILFLYLFIGFVYSVDFVFNNILQKHQQERVQIMLGLKSDPWGYEYNVNQSKIAIGSGGFLGRGFLNGPQTKLKYVPEQSTDFIFCTVGEEWGFLGSFGFIVLYIGLLIRLIYLAERQRSKFSRIYGYGVVSILFFHFAVNVGMAIALFPVIGIPLPFMSYGGSSLMAFTAMIFIFLRLDSTRKAYLI